MWLFGSYVRGEETAESDLDVLVSFDNNHLTLFQYVELQLELSEALGLTVDLGGTQGTKTTDWQTDSARDDSCMTTDTPHIPTMHSYEEIGEFWDTHSLADYWDQTEPAQFEISPQLTKKGLLANMANPTETKRKTT